MLPKPEWPCGQCLGYTWSPNEYVPAYGSGSSGLLFVGEAAGGQEAKEGRPFVEWAPGGAMLERLFKRMAIDRNTQRIHNVLSCHPPRDWLDGAPYETHVTQTCSPLLDQTIQDMKPKCIVALGNVALRRLTSYGGKHTGITVMRGTVLNSQYGLVIATYHPIYLVRGNQELCGVFIHDIRRAQEIAQQGFTRRSVTYTTHPTPEDAYAFLDSYFKAGQPPLDYDIETPKSGKLDEGVAEEEDDSYTIIRISFSFRECEAITFPWQEPYISISKTLLATRSEKSVWNGAFDNPRLIANGCQINGQVLDWMWAWHFLQPSLPMGLQFVSTFYTDIHPWKHLSDSEPEQYSSTDSDTLGRNRRGIKNDLVAQGMWDIFLRHAVELTPVLEQMSVNGLPIDNTVREEMRKDFENKYTERLQKLQELVPAEVRPTHPKYGYKREPKVVTEARDIFNSEKPFEGSGLPRKGESIDAYIYRRHQLQLITVDGIEHWARVDPFLPTSWQQVLAYMKFRKHPVPKHKKENRETTEEDGLRKLARSKKDEVYTLIVECRQLKKVLGTYIEGWAPGPDGRVHPRAGYWGAMYRISWRNPNVGATIADKDEAKALASGFRRCVTAREGHVLLEADWRGIEALLVGWFSGDTNYIRLARLGVHSYITSHLVNEPVSLQLSDEALRERFSQLKKSYPKRYDDAKHINYLCLTGDHEVLTPQGWTPLGSYSGEQPVAQWSDGHVEFTVPSKVTREEHQGTVVIVEGQAISFKSTPTHGVPIIPKRSLLRRVEAQNLNDLRETLRAGFSIPLSGVYHNGDLDFADDVVRLLVATQADGSLVGKTLKFTFKREDKIERLVNTLQRLGITPKLYTFKQNSVVSFPLFVLGDAAKLLTLSKDFSWDLLRLCPTARRVFLDELFYWDGTRFGGYQQYTTVDKQSADVVQALANLDGQQGLLHSFKPNHGRLAYRVSLNKQTMASSQPLKITEDLYDGLVFCVTVPSHWFLIRHKGKISVTGNTNYGGGPKLAAELYGIAQTEAKKIQQTIFTLFPKVKDWQDRTIRQAHEECQLRNPYSYRMWFWDALRWDSRRKQLVRGEDAKPALSFLPRDTAAGMLKEVILRLRDLADAGMLLACIHDALFFEVPEKELPTVARRVKQEMEAPVPQLGGLSVGVELKVGKQWDNKSMHVYEIPEED